MEWELRRGLLHILFTIKYIFTFFSFFFLLHYLFSSVSSFSIFFLCTFFFIIFFSSIFYYFFFFVYFIFHFFFLSFFLFSFFMFREDLLNKKTFGNYIYIPGFRTRSTTTTKVLLFTVTVVMDSFYCNPYF